MKNGNILRCPDRRPCAGPRLWRPSERIVQDWIGRFCQSLKPIGFIFNLVQGMTYFRLLLQVIQPINGDPFIGMLETPVTSSPLVASYLSNLPAYRTGVSPLLRGVEIGLAHGFLLVGPFIKLGPLRDFAGASGNAAEIAGCMSAAGLVLILTLCLSMYGQVTFQNDVPQVGVKTLSGRNVARDALQSSEGWSKFAAGWAVGGLSGVAWGYVCTQILPYYQ